MKKKILFLSLIMLFWLLLSVNAFAYTTNNKYFSLSFDDNTFDSAKLFKNDTSASYSEHYDPRDYKKKNVYFKVFVYKSSYRKGFKQTEVDAFYKTCKDSGYTVVHADVTNIKGFPVFRKTYTGKSSGVLKVFDTYEILSDNYDTTITIISDASIKFTDSAEQLAIINSFNLKDTAKKYGSSVKIDDGPAQTESTGLPFTDVAKNDWYFGAVEYTYKNNLISGYNKSTFAPNDNLTRAMLVTILYKMEGSPATSTKSRFSDVSTTEWYSKPIKWAVDNGIIHGYGGTDRFGPNDNIIRQDLAGILRNYAGYKNKNINTSASLSRFTDAGAVDSYAVPSMQWAVGTGVVTGNANGTLNPKGNSTRAEAAAMIQKYCTKVGR